MISTLWRARLCWCAMDSLVCGLIDWSWGIGTERWGRPLWCALEIKWHKWEILFGFVDWASANVKYQELSVLFKLSACLFRYPPFKNSLNVCFGVFGRIGLRWEHALLLALTFTQARRFQPGVRRSKENWLGHSLCAMRLYSLCCTAVWV